MQSEREQNKTIEIRNGIIIDTTGLIVAPGFIDLHTHLREPGFEYKEDIESGGRAAAAGGFTAIFCMPNTKPVNDNPEVTRYIKKRAAEVSPVKIYPVAAITKDINGEELVDLEAMKGEGILAISDDGHSIQNREVMKGAMEKAGYLDLLVISHAEDYSAGNSRDAENNMIRRDIELVRETGARLHLAHVSTAEGIQMVRGAKERGLKVTCEVTPHHLLLTRRSNFTMNPPLREKADCRALVQGLIDGTVDAIATDHAPHAVYEKHPHNSSPLEGEDKGGGENRPIQPGVIGMETALPVCMRLVEAGDITLKRLIELFTTGPARVVWKNAVPPGGKETFADITIFDPDLAYTIDPSTFMSKARNTPFAGWQVRGKVIYTIVGGVVVYKS